MSAQTVGDFTTIYCYLLPRDIPGHPEGHPHGSKILLHFFSYKNRPNSLKNDILKIKGECYEKLSFWCGTVVNRKTLGDPHQPNRHVSNKVR